MSRQVGEFHGGYCLCSFEACAVSCSLLLEINQENRKERKEGIDSDISIHSHSLQLRVPQFCVFSFPLLLFFHDGLKWFPSSSKTVVDFCDWGVEYLGLFLFLFALFPRLFSSSALVSSVDYRASIFSPLFPKGVRECVCLCATRHARSMGRRAC